MRPKTLTMRGFGPYGREVTIDFDALGEHGLYLITGDTGAGKTTIFDAIAFALFGDCSGSYRAPESLRSQFASAETPTEVELVFVYGNECYTIRRNPSYTRKKLRGTGTTQQLASAELILPGKKAISKPSAVSAKVEEILGINKEQFRQIVMIAQGEFRKAFNAQTSERITIFRKLFGTAAYEEFAKVLARSKREVESAMAKLQYAMAHQASRAVFGNESARLHDYAALAEQALYRHRELRRLLGEQQKEDDRALAALGQELARLDAQKSQLDIQDDQAKRRRAVAIELGQARARQDRASDLCCERERELAAIQEREPEREALEQRIYGLAESLDSYAELDAIKQSLDKAQAEKRQGESAQAQLELSQAQLHELRSHLEALKGVNVEAEKAKAQLDKAQAQCDRLGDLVEQLKSRTLKVQKAQKGYDRAARLFYDAQQKASQSSEGLKALRARFLAGQAGYLAKNLQEGEPCPVCGSTSHPHLAPLAQGAPSSGELKEAEAQEATAQEAANRAFGKAQREKSALEKETAELGALEQTYGTQAELQLAWDQAQKEQEAKRSRWTALCAKAQTLGAQELKAQELEAELQNAQKTVERFKGAWERVAALQASYDTLRHSFEFKDLAQAERALSEARSQLHTLKAERQATKEALSQAKEELSRASAEVAALQKQLSALAAIDEQKLQAQKAALTSRRQEAQRQKDALIGRVSANRQVESELKACAAQALRLKERYQTYQTIADTANGKLNGKEPVSFEAFVLRRYFELVIAAANRRLAVITNNRYELRLSQEARDKRSQAGLELDVFDHYTGMARSVSTLSGGESFEAALSLALGLSDVVQAQSGGVRLDTMFVDEGFGSLDAEALHNAVRMLKSQSGDGKVVGIISHVDALRDAIQSKIIVNGGLGGSTLEVIP